MKPGEIIYGEGEIICNANRHAITLKVTNPGDRPVQIGSHFHFYEVNSVMQFDRNRAYGMRLDIPSGTSARFEPGDTKEVHLVALGGKRCVYGLNNLTNACIDGGQ
ncbi:urease subunit beta [Scopulibacillus cellulosilyticus]|uniref:Urease subunit beta n=1 Tax=Scopulibacillus cellulosilyticus TaxID=2665665 RepID=A0ABW2PVW4_9BACL